MFYGILCSSCGCSGIGAKHKGNPEQDNDSVWHLDLFKMNMELE
jgi:hypothetical protein